MCCHTFDCVVIMLVFKFWGCWLVLHGSLLFDVTGCLLTFVVWIV